MLSGGGEVVVVLRASTRAVHGEEAPATIVGDSIILPAPDTTASAATCQMNPLAGQRQGVQTKEKSMK